MKIKTVIFGGLLTFSAVSGTVKAQSRVVTQATYVLDSTKRDGINMPVINKPADWNMTVHLEVVTSPPDNEYDLRGWVQNDFHDSHTRSIIGTGHVTSDGVPASVTWQTTVMGQPNNRWLFFFPKNGRMEIMDMGARMGYYFHTAP